GDLGLRGRADPRTAARGPSRARAEPGDRAVPRAAPDPAHPPRDRRHPPARGRAPTGRTGPFRERLQPLLTPAEIDATARRVGELLRSGRFPEPGPGRPYP